MKQASALVLIALLAPQTADVQFRDVSDKSGISAYIVSGGEKKNYVLEVNGSGVCWLDYDGDGYLDVYLVNGATLEQLQGKAPHTTTNHLYRNNDDGTFTDSTSEAGVPGRGWGFGCVTADYDNDGNTDLMVTNFGPNILYRNLGNGKFADVTAKAGVGGGDNIWHAGAAFGDYDQDGHLDLYVTGYLEFSVANPELKTCEYRGVRVNACGPMGYKGDPDQLYRNNGDGTFTDVTKKAGVADTGLHFGFQPIFEDFDDDGWPDIFVANDSNANYLYHNKADGTFEEAGVPSGAAYSANGKEMSSMGVAVGDYNNDGRMDVLVATFVNDNRVLFRNEGKGLFFNDVSYPSGLGEPTIPYLAWTVAFLDYDNDGWPDIFAANGHVYPEVDGKLRETYKEPMQMFRNLGNGKFQEVSKEAGLTAMPPRSARGGARADFDNDGDVDILISTIEDKPILLENTGGNRNHWLTLRLISVNGNRDAIGARVKVVTAAGPQYARPRAGDGFMSSSDPRLHFGLGSQTKADAIEIRWPGGREERLANVPADQFLTIREGHGIVSAGPPRRSAGKPVQTAASTR